MKPLSDMVATIGPGYRTLDQFLGRDQCDYCGTNPGEQETCKNCGAPTKWPAWKIQQEKMMMTPPPIIYDSRYIDWKEGEEMRVLPVRSR